MKKLKALYSLIFSCIIFSVLYYYHSVKMLTIFNQIKTVTYKKMQEKIENSESCAAIKQLLAKQMISFHITMDYIIAPHRIHIKKPVEIKENLNVVQYQTIIKIRQEYKDMMNQKNDKIIIINVNGTNAKVLTCLTIESSEYLIIENPERADDVKYVFIGLK